MPLKASVAVAPYDFADYIATAEDARTMIATAFEDGDPGVINHAIGAVARSRGMTALAAETCLTRDALYKGLSPNGNPSLRTVLKVLGVLGLGLKPVTLPPERSLRPGRPAKANRGAKTSTIAATAACRAKPAKGEAKSPSR